MAEFKLTDLISVEVLQQIQDGFSRFTGMASLTTDENGVPVTVGSGFTDFCTNLTRKSELGYERCKLCDRNGARMSLQAGKPSVYSCHAGLTDYAAPIIVDGKVYGSFLGGQVRTCPVDEASMRATALELGIDPDAYVEAAKKTNELEREEIERAADFLFVIAKILSEMAYRNYTALQKSRKLERAARSQSAFIMELSLNMQESMKEWLETTNEVIENTDYETMQRAIKDLHAKGKELYTTVSDAAEYIRMAGDEVELIESEYRIQDVVEQVTESLKMFLDEGKVRVSLRIDKSVPEYMLGDSGRIGQIMSKLLTHILSDMEKGHIVVAAHAHKLSYATILNVEIRDETGELPVEKVKRIQEYFSAENAHLQFADENAELGLTLVSVLARQLSGTVGVENREGKGPIFRISLPQLEVRGE